MTNHTRPIQIIVHDGPVPDGHLNSGALLERVLTRAEAETRAVNALCKDEEFAVGTRGWERKQQALAIVRVVLDAVIT